MDTTKKRFSVPVEWITTAIVYVDAGDLEEAIVAAKEYIYDRNKPFPPGLLCQDSTEVYYDGVEELRWVMTDDDSFQHVRNVDNDVFELVEIGITNPDTGEHEVYTATVDVGKALSDDEIAATLGTLSSFSYKSVEAVREQYGVEVNQVIAECIFEVAAGTHNTVFSGSEDECRKYIQRFVNDSLSPYTEYR